MADELEVIPAEESTSLVPAGDQQITETTPTDVELVADDASDGGEKVIPSQAQIDESFNENLIPVEDLSIKTLRGFLTKHPELQTLDKTNPQFHNWLYGNARRSAALEGYREVFATPESAKDALQAANDMLDLEQDYLQSSNPPAVLQRLYDMALVRDANGQVIGSTGAFEALATQFRNDLFGQIEQHCKQTNNADGVEALNIVKALFGGTAVPARAAGSAEPQDGLTTKERQELDGLRRAQTESGNAAARQYVADLGRSVDGGTLEEGRAIMSDIASKNKLALNDYQKDLIVNDAVKKLAEKAQQDPAYQQTFRQLMRKPRNAETIKEITKHVRQYANRNLVRMVAEGIHQMSGTVISGYTAKQQKLASQRGQANVRSSGPAPSPKTPSMEERLASRQKEFGKRRMSDRDVIDTILAEE